jgi:hypothetical protein
MDSGGVAERIKEAPDLRRAWEDGEVEEDACGTRKAQGPENPGPAKTRLVFYQTEKERFDLDGESRDGARFCLRRGDSNGPAGYPARSYRQLSHEPEFKEAAPKIEVFNQLY